MARRYDSSLIKKMSAGEKQEIFEGVPILVKPIPEGGNPGDMDPRLYKSMKWLPLLIHFLPKPKKSASLSEQILPLRKMFAEYKGDIVVNSGVQTEHVKVMSSDGYEVPVRIYRRENAGKNLPLFIYYHGGGFFGGGPDIVEQMCMVLIQNLDCVVLNVDYRLCPESHYPQPFDDCWCATRWAYEYAEKLGADRTRFAVGGDSAGGNLAAAVTLRDREEGTGMIGLQVLLYPAVNIAGKTTEFYHGINNSLYQRSKRHAKVLDASINLMSRMLDTTDLLTDVYLQGYLSPESVYASPLLDDFHNLPPTMLVFGEHDMLVFEDFAYAKTALKAGVNLKTIVYRGLGHGFADQIGVIPQAEDCMKEIAKEIKRVFEGR